MQGPHTGMEVWPGRGHELWESALLEPITQVTCTCPVIGCLPTHAQSPQALWGPTRHPPWAVVAGDLWGGGCWDQADCQEPASSNLPLALRCFRWQSAWPKTRDLFCFSLSYLKSHRQYSCISLHRPAGSKKAAGHLHGPCGCVFTEVKPCDRDSSSSLWNMWPLPQEGWFSPEAQKLTWFFQARTNRAKPASWFSIYQIEGGENKT